MERESTQDYLATAHPLVRHLTLGRDGVSDPPGIKVRARKGLDAVMYVPASISVVWQYAYDAHEFDPFDVSG